MCLAKGISFTNSLLYNCIGYRKIIEMSICDYHHVIDIFNRSSFSRHLHILFCNFQLAIEHPWNSVN